MTTFLYFAYGSNLCPDQMQRRCGDVRRVGPAKLEGYALAFAGHSPRWGGTVATIVESRPHWVFGAVYQMEAPHLDRLDAFEGNYERRQVQLADLSEPAWTYVHTQPAPIAPPPHRYLAIIAHQYGALGHGLSPLMQAVERAGRGLAHPEDD